MNQEDLNSMMGYPWDRTEPQRSPLPECPVCGERYLGDGKALCTECEACAQRAQGDSHE